MNLRVVPIVWYNLARFFIYWYFSSPFLIVIITQNRDPFVIPTHFLYFVSFRGSRQMGHQQRKPAAKLCNNILAVKMVRDNFNWFSVNTLLEDSILKLQNFNQYSDEEKSQILRFLFCFLTAYQEKTAKMAETVSWHKDRSHVLKL